MITAFPPQILVCIDKKYKAPRAFIQEDAMQLMVDDLARQFPDQGWDRHDISGDETVRARRIEGASDGEHCTYQGKTQSGRTLTFRVLQFDRNGCAKIDQMLEA